MKYGAAAVVFVVGAGLLFLVDLFFRGCLGIIKGIVKGIVKSLYRALGKRELPTACQSDEEPGPTSSTAGQGGEHNF